MRRWFYHGEHHNPERAEYPRISIVGRVFMVIGVITVLYLLITYVLMPILAMLTIS